MTPPTDRESDALTNEPPSLNIFAQIKLLQRSYVSSSIDDYVRFHPCMFQDGSCNYFIKATRRRAIAPPEAFMFYYSCLFLLFFIFGTLRDISELFRAITITVKL